MSGSVLSTSLAVPHLNCRIFTSERVVFFFFISVPLKEFLSAMNIIFLNCRFVWLISQVVKLQVSSQVKVFGGGRIIEKTEAFVVTFHLCINN
jgi:hypothetical protein